MRWSAIAAAFVVVGALPAVSGCGPKVTPGGDSDGTGVPSITPTETGPSAALVVGQNAVVVTGALNLRQAAGTDAAVLVVMPCGSVVAVVNGPESVSTSDIWWQVQYVDATGTPWSGWASGKYLALPQDFVEGTCGGSVVAYDFAGVDLAGTNDDLATPSAVAQMFSRAELGVGYSYWWGHGAWRSDALDPGTCSGDCPSCTHDGSYGADCSGYVAKIWQVPSATALADDEHPYSTADFYDSTSLWTVIDRSDVQPGDAMVYRSGDEGHIVLVDTADDPYGSIWMYEAYGCAAGIIHDMRTLDSSYRAIRLNSP